MNQHCRHCGRQRPEYIVDPSCEKGGYCDWVEVVSVETKETCFAWCPETGEKCTGERCIGANCEKANQRRIKEEGEEYESELIATDYVSAYPVGLREEPGKWKKSKPYPLDAIWLTPNQPRTVGQRLTWSFPGPTIIEGFEVKGLEEQAVEGVEVSDFSGFITSLQVGNVEYLYVGPYPICMFSPGMPKPTIHLPHVPVGVYLSMGLDYFSAKIRPIGTVLLRE